MRKKLKSNKGDMGDYETTYGMAIRPENQSLPDGLSVHPRSSMYGSQGELHGFVSPKAMQMNRVLIPNQMEIGEMKIADGWTNDQPCFLIICCQEDIQSLQSLPILVLRPGAFLSKHGALLSLELDLHRSEWPIGHWTMMFDPAMDSDQAFLRSLIQQPEIFVILASVPLDERSMTHIVYHPSTPLGSRLPMPFSGQACISKNWGGMKRKPLCSTS